MPTAKDKVYDAAGNVKPYIERAVADEKLRQDVLSAFATARELYSELVASRGPVTTLATRVATDDEVQEKLKAALDDLRSAANRLQGRRERSRRNARLLVLGIVIGILFNPITGPDTRRWLKETLTGGSDEFGGDYPPATTNGGS